MHDQIIARRALPALGAVLAAGTAAALSAAPAQARSGYNFGYKTLKRGDRGRYVRDLQNALNRFIDRGFSPGRVDGVFGAKTERSVRSYQKQKRLVVDGRVGPATRRALYADDAAACGKLC